MVKEISEHIFRLEVPLPDTPLRRLNSYFIRGEKRDFLIDTGFARTESRKGLAECLDEVGSDPKRRDLVITHLHADHSGLAGEFAGPDSRIYMSQVDLGLLKRMVENTMFQKMDARLELEGFPSGQAAKMKVTSPARVTTVKKIDGRFCPLKDGDVIENGRFSLKTVMVPGHTPGNAMFWMEEEKIMFTGDHILFDISPNITAWETMDDSLGSYLESLKKAKEYPVRLALPGHRETGDYQGRIDEILLHHEKRLSLALEIVTKDPGLTAYEIAGKMKWKLRGQSWEEAPVYSKWFAVGECLSHLDHLMKSGKMVRKEKDGFRRYFPA